MPEIFTTEERKAAYASNAESQQTETVSDAKNVRMRIVSIRENKGSGINRMVFVRDAAKMTL